MNRQDVSMLSDIPTNANTDNSFNQVCQNMNFTLSSKIVNTDAHLPYDL